MARSPGQRKTKRWPRRGVGGALLALLGALLILQQAVALTGSSFEILDGNEEVGDADKLDWASQEVIDGQTLLPDESQSPTDESISGSEDDTRVAVTAGSIQPNKSDIVGVRKFSDNENGTDFLYLAFDRFPTTNGVTAIDFELNQKTQGTVPAPGGTWKLDRTAGDKLLVFEMVNGGTVPVISMMTWVTGATDDCEKNGQVVPCWGDKQLLTPETNPAAEGSVNQTGGIVFGEMAIDLEAAGVFEADACTSFASLYAKSRSSGSSLSNQISDLVKPKETTVSNCGSVTVEKTVVGPTVAGDDASFGFTVSCPGADLDPVAAGDQESIQFELGAGASRKVNDVPVGTDCTVTEAAPDPDDFATTYALTGQAGGSGRIAVAEDVPLSGKAVSFTNTRDLGEITISKTVAGGTGSPSFDFTVVCQEHPAANASFTLRDGGSKTISGIPVGVSCLVTETDPGSDWSTKRSIDSAAGTTGTSATIVADGDGGSVAYTNIRNLGKLIVTKATSGGTGTFAFTASCTGHPLARADASFSLSGGATKEIAGIPTGTTCTVTEAEPGSDWATTYAIDGGTATTGRSTSTVVDADDTTVAFTNTRQTAGLTVSKTVVGPTNTDDPTSFSFEVDCQGATLASGDSAFTLGGGTSKTISGIPTSTSCTVTETDPGSGWSTTRSVDAGSASPGRSASTTVDADGTTVAVTNVRTTGSLTITKTATGGDGTFDFTVDCVGTTFDRTVTVTTTSGAGSSATITDIPTETDCTVTEVVPAGWTVAGGAIETITIDGPETAAFANRLLASGFEITKTPSALTVHAGDTVTYTYVVTNPGENPLSSVQVVDDKCATVTFVSGDDGDDHLEPGEAWTFTCASELTATTTNVATATGVDPRSQTRSDTAHATVVVIEPAIAIDKAPSATSVAPGATVVYTYTVTNAGDVPLTAVAVADDKCSPVSLAGGDANGDGILQLTETWVFRCSQVQTGAVETLTNVGTATGTDPLGLVVTATDAVTVAVVAPLVIAQPTPPDAVVLSAPTLTPIATAPVTLPRTGIDVNGWLRLGASLILLGVSLLVTSRDRRRPA